MSCALTHGIRRDSLSQRRSWRHPRFIMSRSARRLFLTLVFLLHLTASAQTVVEDIFGRSLNQRGITLVDWDGYIANPLIKFYIRPPTNAALPGSAKLTA